MFLLESLNPGVTGFWSKSEVLLLSPRHCCWPFGSKQTCRISFKISQCWPFSGLRNQICALVAAAAFLMLPFLSMLCWMPDLRSSIPEKLYSCSTFPFRWQKQAVVALSVFLSFFPPSSFLPLYAVILYACWVLVCRIIITVWFLRQRRETPWKQFSRRLWRAPWLTGRGGRLVCSVTGRGTAWKRLHTPLFFFVFLGYAYQQVNRVAPLVCVEPGRLCREVVFVKRTLSGFGLDLRWVENPTVIVWPRRFLLDRVNAIIIHFQFTKGNGEAEKCDFSSFTHTLHSKENSEYFLWRP